MSQGGCSTGIELESKLPIHNAVPARVPIQIRPCVSELVPGTHAKYPY
eukprot:gene7860-biopygen14383